MSAGSLALSIARCAQLDAAAAAGAAHGTHPCARVVSFQTYGFGSGAWQVPEPWRGDLANAPLLFVSSNPSIDPLDDAPWNHEPDAAVLAYYGAPRIAPGFPRSMSRLGQRSKRAVAFWAGMHARAVELMGAAVRPGVDYALTEVVHCKSRDEFGVDDAAAECASRHLAAVLAASKARVIVCFGAVAQRHVPQALAARTAATGGAAPIVLGLPHPVAFVRRTVRECIEADLAARARQALAGD